MDTVEGIQLAINATLQNFKYKQQYTIDEVRSFVGRGSRYLFSKATKKRIINETEFQYYMMQYIKYQSSAKCYPGVEETLNKLYYKGYELIIYSNKPDGALNYLIEEKLNFIKWSAIRGNSEEFKPKPNVESLFDVYKKIGITNGDVGYYVGDSSIDCETAKNANLTSIICTYGYGNINDIKRANPDFLINDFKNLIDIL